MCCHLLQEENACYKGKLCSIRWAMFDGNELFNALVVSWWLMDGPLHLTYCYTLRIYKKTKRCQWFDIAIMATKMATQWSKSNQYMAIPHNTLLVIFSQIGSVVFPKLFFMIPKHIANKLWNWGVATWQQLYGKGAKYQVGHRQRISCVSY